MIKAVGICQFEVRSSPKFVGVLSGSAELEGFSVELGMADASWSSKSWSESSSAKTWYGREKG